MLVRRAFRGERDAVGRKYFPVNEIATGVADEGVVHKLRPVGIAPVNRRAGRAGEVAGDAPAALDHAGHHAADAPARAHDAPRLVRAEAEDLRRRAVRRDADARVGHGEGGVPRSVAQAKEHHLQVVAVAAHKLAAEAVEGQAVLPAARLGLEAHAARVETEVASAQIERRAGVGSSGFHGVAADGAGRAVDAIVEAPVQRVDERLHVEPRRAAAETGEDYLALVRLAVAIRILQPEDVGRRADEDAAAVADDRGGPRQVVGKDGGLVELAVAVRVFEQPDAPRVRRLVAPLGVVNHLDHEEPAVLVEGHRDRAVDERFAGDEFEAKTLLHLEGRRRVRRLDCREARHILRRHLRRSAGLAVSLGVSDARLRRGLGEGGDFDGHSQCGQQAKCGRLAHEIRMVSYPATGKWE